jgi:hypothetical protein
MRSHYLDWALPSSKTNKENTKLMGICDPNVYKRAYARLH